MDEVTAFPANNAAALHSAASALAAAAAVAAVAFGGRASGWHTRLAQFDLLRSTIMLGVYAICCTAMAAFAILVSAVLVVVLLPAAFSQEPTLFQLVASLEVHALTVFAVMYAFLDAFFQQVLPALNAALPAAATAPPTACPRRLSLDLPVAAMLGNLADLRLCLEAGADPNEPTRFDSLGAVHLAACQGQVACLAALLEAGTDVDACAATRGRTPLHCACMGCHEECVALLLAAGACPNASAADGWTPALYTACCNLQQRSLSVKVAVMRRLVEASPAAMLAASQHGATPLGMLLYRGEVSVAHCILEAGLVRPVGALLAFLHKRGPQALPLYPALAAGQALTPAEWAQFPSPCPGLGSAWPAVLARSAEEAALLVAHLPPEERQWKQHVVAAARGALTAEQWAGIPSPCPGLGMVLPAVLARSIEEAALLVSRLPDPDSARLHAAALCLAGAQGKLGIMLPSPIVWQLLALSAV